MAEGLEAVARVGLAVWLDGSPDGWDAVPILGMIGDEFYLVEIDAGNRERVIMDVIDKHVIEAPPRSAGAVPLIDDYVMGDRGLRIEIAFFGDAGGFFASSVSFLALWPKSVADVPAEVFVDNNHKAAFTKVGDEVIVSVRHVLRPSDRPPKRRFCFYGNKYEQAMSDLVQESRRLRDDVIAIAQQRTPQKLESLREAFKHWPA